MKWLGPGPGQGFSFYSPRLWESCAVRLKNSRPEVCVWDEWPTFHSSFLVSVSGTAAITTRPYAVQPLWLCEAGSRLIVHDGVYSAKVPHGSLPFPSSPLLLHPPCPLSCPCGIHTVRQRSTKLAHPPPNSTPSMAPLDKAAVFAAC